MWELLPCDGQKCKALWGYQEEFEFEDLQFAIRNNKISGRAKRSIFITALIFFSQNKELKKWMPLDQFGHCNKKVCADNEKCYDSMEGNYKFYLSFENSLCQDYITEKFWNFLGKTI